MKKINKTEQLIFRITEIEKLELEEICNKTGLDYSKIIRKALLEFKRNYYRKEVLREKDVYGLPRADRKIRN